MHVPCACGAGINLTTKKYRQTLRDLDCFCGVACFLQFYKELPDVAYEDVVMSPTVMTSEPEETWCDVTRAFYRSKSEMYVARFFTYEKMPFVYESRTIWQGQRPYTPDFLLTDKDLLIEVKGLWLGSSKMKLRRAAKDGENIALIPDYMVQHIKFYNRRHHEIRKKASA